MKWEPQQLPSGLDVAEGLMELDNLEFDTVEEISQSYFMKYDPEGNTLIMEPAWFYLSKGNWSRFIPERLGGAPIGLE